MFFAGDGDFEDKNTETLLREKTRRVGLKPRMLTNIGLTKHGAPRRSPLFHFRALFLGTGYFPRRRARLLKRSRTGTSRGDEV